MTGQGSLDRWPSSSSGAAQSRIRADSVLMQSPVAISCIGSSSTMHISRPTPPGAGRPMGFDRIAVSVACHEIGRLPRNQGARDHAAAQLARAVCSMKEGLNKVACCQCIRLSNRLRIVGRSTQNRRVVADEYRSEHDRLDGCARHVGARRQRTEPEESRQLGLEIVFLCCIGSHGVSCKKLFIQKLLSAGRRGTLCASDDNKGYHQKHQEIRKNSRENFLLDADRRGSVC